MLLHKNTLLTLFLLLSLLLSIWATRTSIALHTHNNSTTEETRDAFMTNVDYISYNTEGHWESKFSSPHLDQYAQNRKTVLQNPTLHAMGEENLSWKITAKYATTYRDSRHVILEKDVVIERLDHNNEESTFMNTTIMTLDPDARYLSTDAPVTIQQPTSTIEAIGLQADLNSGDIHLPANTKTIYQHSPDQ